MSGLRTKLILGLFMLLGASVLAQSRTDGVVSGEITDEFGALIPDVQITAKTNEGESFSFRSTTNGTYEMQLPKGIYSLTFKRPPFKMFSVENYQVSDRSRMKLDVSLICENCERTDPVADVPVPESQFMAELKDKLPDNVWGKFYVERMISLTEKK